MGKTDIEWCTDVWNPVRGCTKISEGCRNCYAMRMAHRFSGPGKAYEGLTKLIKSGPTWTGDVRLVPENLEQPLHWRKPRRIFVDSMSDLFHEKVPDEFIDKVLAVGALCPQHTLLILTKRAERLPEYFNHPERADRVGNAIMQMVERWEHKPPIHLRNLKRLDAWSAEGDGLYVDWPLPNVHLYVSVENQETADERIPHLLATPTAVRGVSAEPLLGPIVIPETTLHGIFDHCPEDHGGDDDCQGCPGWGCECAAIRGPAINHVIVGGESGPGARPCDIEWIRSIVEQCRTAGVPPFVKQDSGPKPGQQGRIPDELWVKEMPL